MNDTERFLSIIIPIYNGESFIRNCVDSIIKQNIKDLEIIMVDDGSTDSTYAICCEIQKENDNVLIIRQQNSGVSIARNTGIRAAHGKWISFVDVDDIVTEEFFSFCKIMEENDADIILGKIKYEGSKCGGSTPSSIQIITDNKQMIRFALDKYSCDIVQRDFYFTSSCGKGFRKSFIIQNEIFFPENIISSEDFLFNLLAFNKSKKNIFINSIIYQYQTNGNSVTHSFNPSLVNNFIEVTRLTQKYLSQSYFNDNVIKNAYLCRLLSNILFTLQGCICHPNNNASYRERENTFKELIAREEYLPLYEIKLHYNNFPIAKRVISYLVIKKQFAIVDILLRNSTKILRFKSN